MFLVGPKVFSFVVKGVKVIFWGVQRRWGLLSLQSQEILNRPVFVLDILKITKNSEKILNITENSEQILKIAENSEQILNITENSEQILNIAENSEQILKILNIIFLLKSIYFTSFSLDFNSI